MDPQEASIAGENICSDPRGSNVGIPTAVVKTEPDTQSAPVPEHEKRSTVVKHEGRQGNRLRPIKAEQGNYGLEPHTSPPANTHRGPDGSHAVIVLSDDEVEDLPPLKDILLPIKTSARSRHAPPFHSSLKHSQETYGRVPVTRNSNAPTSAGSSISIATSGQLLSVWAKLAGGGTMPQDLAAVYKASSEQFYEVVDEVFDKLSTKQRSVLVVKVKWLTVVFQAPTFWASFHFLSQISNECKLIRGDIRGVEILDRGAKKCPHSNLIHPILDDLDTVLQWHKSWEEGRSQVFPFFLDIQLLVWEQGADRSGEETGERFESRPLLRTRQACSVTDNVWLHRGQYPGLSKWLQ
ncbi:hypothetical protein NM208_g11781 [Fusarium decemcellulare]|uniref:Uncharacterized protein n=1 Tax=Fusarium decemcellulare TaxID=57161 RepID=A0ACC1RT07_9HYPO|nr:hypothetical protein NM208_g11781 [Fusarium decemcellulare]